MGNKLEHPIVELPEKLAIVTGANTGIGYETAKALAAMGATVLIACRSEDKAKAAIDRMQTEHRHEVHKKRLQQDQAKPSAEEEEVEPLKVEYMKLDLSSLQSTMDFIQQTKQRTQSLNILVCNAGIAFAKQDYTEDKFESHFQVNYLSHLLIVLHLLPLLRAGIPNARIVCLSSSAHTSGKLDLDNMQGRKSYSRYTAYGSSKAYMIMIAHFLARRLEGTGVSTYSVDPGVVDTDIRFNFSDWKLMSFAAGAGAKMGLFLTPKQGAATSVVACVDPALSGQTGVFLKNCRPASHSNFCRDEAKQETLWQYSLGCLDTLISDDILKEAFPTANADLLIIPKDTKTQDEPTEGESAKKGKESSDTKAMELEPLADGETSSGQKEAEKPPEEASASAAVEVHSETPKTSQEPEAGKSMEEKAEEEKAMQDSSKMTSESSEVAGAVSEEQVEERPTEHTVVPEDSSSATAEVTTQPETNEEGEQTEEKPTDKMEEPKAVTTEEDVLVREDSTEEEPTATTEEPEAVATEEDVSVKLEDTEDKPGEKTTEPEVVTTEEDVQVKLEDAEDKPGEKTTEPEVVTTEENVPVKLEDTEDKPGEKTTEQVVTTEEDVPVKLEDAEEKVIEEEEEQQ